MKNPKRVVAFLIQLASVAFVLNWFWEMIQMPAYVEMANKSWLETAIPCAIASLGDVVMTLAVYGIGALASGDKDWAMKWNWRIYSLCSLLGASMATAYEWRILAFHRWHYSTSMPIVPVLGVGFWPLLQMAVLVPFSLWAATVVSSRVLSSSPK